MKTKILLAFLMTLTVIVGGWIYYDSMLSKPSYEAAIASGSEMFIVALPVAYPADKQLKSDSKLPKYKPSTKNLRHYGSSTSSINLGQSSMVSDLRYSRPATGKHTAGYQASKPEGNDKNFNTTTTGLLVQGYVGGQNRNSGTSLSESDGAGSSYIAALSTPMLAQNSPSFNLNTGLSGNPDDPSDDFLPPEGAPVGGGIGLLLILSGVYIFFKRKYAST